jgi:MFS family permease
MGDVEATPALRHRHHVRAALRSGGFRRLFGVRLAAQCADGLFQLSLAGAVLFNPERQAHAADIAAGFAVLLLPYSVIGPFAGVLLDRWSRQRVLVWTSVLRALAVAGLSVEIATGLHGIPFYASALVVVSISRFFLSALSASLPHVVGHDELVTANAMSTTFGALAAAWRAAGFFRSALGPDEAQRAHRESAGDIARGLAAGLAHLRSRRPALLALGAMGVHRLCYGLFAVCTVLLYRNRFADDGLFRTGLAGLAQLVIVLALGSGLAALVTPPASRHTGMARWCGAMLAGAGLVQLTLVLPYRLPLYLSAALLLGFCSQGLKICIDTIVQRTVTDEYRGRIFALYDMLFNIALVTAAAMVAVILPADGHSPVSVVVIAVAYLATAFGYTRLAGSQPALNRRPAAEPTSV